MSGQTPTIELHEGQNSPDTKQESAAAGKAEDTILDDDNSAAETTKFANCTRPIRMAMRKFCKSRWSGCLLGPLMGAFLYAYITHLGILEGRPFTDPDAEYHKQLAAKKSQ